MPLRFQGLVLELLDDRFAGFQRGDQDALIGREFRKDALVVSDHREALDAVDGKAKLNDVRPVAVSAKMHTRHPRFRQFRKHRIGFAAQFPEGIEGAVQVVETETAFLHGSLWSQKIEPAAGFDLTRPDPTLVQHLAQISIGQSERNAEFLRQLTLIEVGLVLEQFKQVQCALFFRSHVCLEKGMAPPSALHRCLRIGVPDGNENGGQ